MSRSECPCCHAVEGEAHGCDCPVACAPDKCLGCDGPAVGMFQFPDRDAWYMLYDCGSRFSVPAFDGDDRSDFSYSVQCMRRQRDALAARVKALEEACRPFDDLHALCGVRQYDKLASFTDKNGNCAWFTVGELRRLHEALVQHWKDRAEKAEAKQLKLAARVKALEDEREGKETP